MLSKLFARRKMTNEEERNDLENRVCSMLHDQKMVTAPSPKGEGIKGFQRSK